MAEMKEQICGEQTQRNHCQFHAGEDNGDQCKAKLLTFWLCPHRKVAEDDRASAAIMKTTAASYQRPR